MYKVPEEEINAMVVELDIRRITRRIELPEGVPGDVVRQVVAGILQIQQENRLKEKYVIPNPHFGGSIMKQNTTVMTLPPDIDRTKILKRGTNE